MHPGLRAHVLKARNPHILNLSPPLNLRPPWLGIDPAYTLSKYGMSLLALGVAEEFRKLALLPTHRGLVPSLRRRH